MMTSFFCSSLLRMLSSPSHLQSFDSDSPQKGPDTVFFLGIDGFDAVST